MVSPKIILGSGRIPAKFCQRAESLQEHTLRRVMFKVEKRKDMKGCHEAETINTLKFLLDVSCFSMPTNFHIWWGSPYIKHHQKSCVIDCFSCKTDTQVGAVKEKHSVKLTCFSIPVVLQDGKSILLCQYWLHSTFRTFKHFNVIFLSEEDHGVEEEEFFLWVRVGKWEWMKVCAILRGL